MLERKTSGCFKEKKQTYSYAIAMFVRLCVGATSLLHLYLYELHRAHQGSWKAKLPPAGRSCAGSCVSATCKSLGT